MQTPILRIYNGATKVDLLSRCGFTLKEWVPNRLALKDGGVWQNSPLAAGRRLSHYAYENITDTFTLHVAARDQDGAIRSCQNLDRLLTEAIDYHVSTWPTVPVYLEARGPEETNTRYALVYGYEFPHDGDAYNAPFFASIKRYAIQDVDLVVEHGPWLNLPPGQEACVELSAQQDFDGITYGKESGGTCLASEGEGGFLLQEEDIGQVDYFNTEEDVADEILLESGYWKYGAFVCNKHNLANITHIFAYDDSAGTYSANKVGAATPFDILPAIPDAPDFTVFGIDTSVTGAGPFSSLVFDISTPMDGGTITWEYLATGATWTAFGVATIHDQTMEFTDRGPSGVYWLVGPDWEASDVTGLGVTGFWVRALLVGTPTTGPQQDNRDIYTVVVPRVEIGSEQVSGDIPALAHIKAYNVSESSTWSHDSIDRLFVGLRSVSRGDPFTPYLNCSNGQNTPGLVVSTNAVFNPDTSAPSGICVRAAGLAALSEKYVQFAFSPGLSQTYRGSYHAFCRMRQYAGAGHMVSCRLQSGVIVLTTFYKLWEGENSDLIDTVSADGDYHFYLLDLGRISLPPTSPADLFNEMVVRLVIKNNAPINPISIDAWDLILIPVDEWSGTFSRVVAGTDIGYGNLLDIDSITDPKTHIKSSNKLTSGEYVIAPYQTVSNGPAILQPNVSQRMWFLAADGVQSYPSTVLSVRVGAVNRYQSMRGDR